MLAVARSAARATWSPMEIDDKIARCLKWYIIAASAMVSLLNVIIWSSCSERQEITLFRAIMYISTSDIRGLTPVFELSIELESVHLLRFWRSEEGGPTITACSQLQSNCVRYNWWAESRDPGNRNIELYWENVACSQTALANHRA